MRKNNYLSLNVNVTQDVAIEEQGGKRTQKINVIAQQNGLKIKVITACIKDFKKKKKNQRFVFKLKHLQSNDN